MNKSNNKHVFIILLTSILTLIGCSTTAEKVVPKDDNFKLETARFGHATVNDGKKIYVIGGANKKKYLSDIEIIDPETHEKVILKNRIIPRRYISAVWDGKESIYIIGGVSKQSGRVKYERTIEVFNILTHDVTTVTPIPLATRTNSSVYLNNYIFVFGGSYHDNKSTTASAIVTVYDIKNDKWHRMADMPTARTAKAVEKDGLIYVVGGYNTRWALKAVEQFNPKTNKWATLASLPVELSGHSLAILNDKLYTFGDYKDSHLTFVYSFETKQWKQTNLNYKPSRHNASTVLNDTIYVIGGNTAATIGGLDHIQTFNMN